MSDDVRHTWHNERWVINRLVDAVEAGDRDAKTKLGQRLLDGIDDDNWDAWTVIEVGPYLPLTFLDPDNIEDDDLEWLCDNGAIPEERALVVLNGGELIDAELTRWREFVVERAFSPGEFDRWMLWFITEVRRTGGRVAYVASFGYVDLCADWYDLPNTSFVAAYDTYTETMNGLKSVGFISEKDVLVRSHADARDALI